MNLADLRGTPMVLNVWAAWCEICNEEMPVLAAGMRRAGDRVRFFGVHYDAAEKYGEQSAADFGVPFASAHDEDGDRVTRRAAGRRRRRRRSSSTADGKVAGRKIGAIQSQARARPAGPALPRGPAVTARTGAVRPSRRTTDCRSGCARSRTPRCTCGPRS